MAEVIDLRLKPPCDRDDALVVLKRLREVGHLAYFAGGCVRDTLLGRTPKDWDIATDAPPDRVRKIFPNTQAVGAAFGVILVRHRQSVIEIATFRSDGVYTDGRRPESVRYTTAEEDAKRRDFTINGLFLDPIENKVIDYVGGQDDLKNRRLRSIGKPMERFEEDHLRLLRAIRFAARFDLQIDPATADAMRSSAARLKGITPERIGDELRLILTPPTRISAWKLLWDFRLAREIFRFLVEPVDIALDPAHSLFLAMSSNESISFPLAMAVATLDVRLRADPKIDLRILLEKAAVQKAVQAMRKALRLSNDESDEMDEILSRLRPMLMDEPPTLAAKRRFLAFPTSPQSRALMQALLKIGLCSDRIASLQRDLSALDHQDNAPAPLITGDDLVADGLAPGPKFKIILDAIYDAQLEANITTREQAMDLARQLKPSS